MEVVNTEVTTGVWRVEIRDERTGVVHQRSIRRFASEAECEKLRELTENRLVRS